MPSPDLARLEAELAGSGLRLVGGFVPGPGDGVPAVGAIATATVLVIGSAGSHMWRHFSRSRLPGPDPLDTWTRSVLDPMARAHGCAAVFPFDKPALPFQRWAGKAAPLHTSPLGLLIDPVHGLWHALRGAFLSQFVIPLPARVDAASPCESCKERPCLSACPVGAFTGTSLDVGRCAGHISTSLGRPCMEGGCRAREACPVGRASRYDDEQVRFHMDAYRRSIAPHAGQAEYSL